MVDAGPLIAADLSLTSYLFVFGQVSMVAAFARRASSCCIGRLEILVDFMIRSDDALSKNISWPSRTFEEISSIANLYRW